MPARFTKLNSAMSKGLDSMPAGAAVEQIEYWEEQMKDIDVSGSKGILSDLHALKGKLQSDEIDGDAVVKMLADLGEKTSKISGRVDDEKVASQLKGVGEGLTAAG